MRRYELEAIHDSRKSFYHKVIIESSIADNGLVKLYSYDTHVCTIDVNAIETVDQVKLEPAWDASSTTLRHVREFLRQYGFKADSKAQVAKDYSH